MTRTTTCFSIILIAGFAMVKLIDTQSDACVNLSDVLANDKKVQELAVNYFTFKHSFDATLTALGKGEITLADARERVDALATRYQADYFTHLARVELGASKEERIARNLVGHIASLEETAPNPNSHLPRLEMELAEFLEELESRR